MYVLLIILHVIVSFIMVSVILLQAGKGAEIGASFGGSSQTVFGSRGPGTFLSKLTVSAAVIFMLTSLSLSVLSKGRFLSTSVLDLKKAPPAAEAPAPPAANGGAAPSATAPANPAEGQSTAPVNTPAVPATPAPTQETPPKTAP
ncbi:MAG TPA: preprotein translocase subunit SecG [Nitrospiria bacterium]|nr:preprotein translocase subunit SecG [Nitrospiria bacterium]